MWSVTGRSRSSRRWVRDLHSAACLPDGVVSAGHADVAGGRRAARLKRVASAWLADLRRGHLASQPCQLPPSVPLLTAPPQLACPHTCAGQQRGALLPSPVLRSAVLFRRPFYLYLMASNLVLRLGWLYRLSPHLRHHHAVVTLMVLVEAFRWGMWLAAAGSAGHAYRYGVQRALTGAPVCCCCCSQAASCAVCRSLTPNPGCLLPALPPQALPVAVCAHRGGAAQDPGAAARGGGAGALCATCVPGAPLGRRSARALGRRQRPRQRRQRQRGGGRRRPAAERCCRASWQGQEGGRCSSHAAAGGPQSAVMAAERRQGGRGSAAVAKPWLGGARPRGSLGACHAAGERVRVVSERPGVRSG